MEMFEFFYEEFKTLRAKTGIRQWETLNEAADPKSAINEVINPMVEECEREHFGLIKPEVKQRVIRDAIMNDQDFIGLNAKFVRKALNAFWNLHGERILQARDQKQNTFHVRELSKEEKQNIDQIANKFLADLLQGDSGIKPVPKAPIREGREWTSALEIKASGYSNGLTVQDVELKDRIRTAAAGLYKGKMSLNLKPFTVEGIRIMAESESDALQIFEKATVI